MTAIPIDSEVIEAARLAGIGVVKRTPITESATLSERYGGNVVFKAENLQRTGSFKIRGAMSNLHRSGIQ